MLTPLSGQSWLQSTPWLGQPFIEAHGGCLSGRLFILKEGQVEVYRLTLDGRRLVTRRIGPGRVFGEMGLLGQTMEGCFAEAIEPSLVCSASREDVLRLIRERLEVALRLLETVTNHLRIVEERLQQVVFSPVKVRLATFLLANADPPTGPADNFTSFVGGRGSVRFTTVRVTCWISGLPGAGQKSEWDTSLSLPWHRSWVRKGLMDTKQGTCLAIWHNPVDCSLGGFLVTAACEV